MKQRITDILCVVVIALLPIFSPVSGEIRVLESGAAGFLFEFTPEVIELEDTPDGEFVDVVGSQYTQEVGRPFLPFREFHLGIPYGATHTVELLDIRVREEQPVEIVPVPQVFSDRGLSRYDFTRDETFYSRDQYYPAEPLTVDPPSFLRDQRVLTLLLPLARYNPLRKTLLILEEAKIKVTFSPPGTAKEWKAGPIEDVYSRLLLNYDEAKHWRQRRSKQVADDPFLQSNFWYKILTVQDGAHGLEYSDFVSMGVDPASIDPRTIKIFNGGSRPLPNSLSDPRPDLTEIPLYVQGEDDGNFAPADYVLFYALSTSRFEYDPDQDDFVYFENSYADTNVYWLTWGGEEGARMVVESGGLSSTAPSIPLSFPTSVRIERNRSDPDKVAFKWVDEAIPFVGYRDYDFPAYGVDPNLSGTLSGRLRLGKPRDEPAAHKFRVLLNGISVWRDSLNASPWEEERWINIGPATVQVAEGENVLRIENLGDINSTINPDYFEVEYDRFYSWKGNDLSFTLPRAYTPGVNEFRISGFAAHGPLLFDVTNPLVPRRIVDFVVKGDTLLFQSSVDSRKLFYLTNTAKLKNPERIEIADVAHLRSSSGGDYVIVVHDDFFYAIQDLLAWRREDPELHNPVAVTISSVYDEFSWGLKDPVAIRDFLKYWYEHGLYTPVYCFLVGDGTYDYKNHLGLHSYDNLIPPTSECVDDWFGILQPGSSFRDVCIGRITPHTPEEAGRMVRRIVEYERNPNYGFWRNRILLLADNYLEGGGDFPGDTEILARLHTPSHFDVRKIHLVYRTYDSPEEWPSATDDAIDEWSEGFLAGCYMGHGGPHTVAHELLLLYKDIFSFENSVRLPLFYFASCDLGRYDVPGDPCLGEDLLKVDNGGAVAVVAASRATVHPGMNRELAYALFDEIFFNDSTPTLGKAMLVAKRQSWWKHNLLGDPACRITSADPVVRLRASPDSMVSRTRVSVVDSLPAGFTGYANLYAFDSVEEDSVDPGLTLNIPGVPMYRGIFPADEVDTTIFMVPMQPRWTGDLGRIICYAWSDTQEIVGALDSIRVGGTGPIPSDTAGPAITLLEGERILKDGDSVPPGFQLTGILEDTSGIYIVPRRPPWFFLEVNGYLEADLSRHFVYDAGSSTKGSFDYTLTLSEGENTVRVVARDNLLKTARKSLTLQVNAPSALEIRYAFNYPNPVTDATYFTFYLTGRAECEIRIFTVSGRLVAELGEIDGRVGQNQVHWDGRDADGDAIANGVYLYKITAWSHSDSSEWGEVRSETSLIEKLVVMR